MAALIEASTFEDDADLESLFVLAQIFDDGHGRTAIRFEGCWHCDKPLLFHFGGDGGFIGRGTSVQGSSSMFMQLGQELDAALAAAHIDGAAVVLQRHLANVLAGGRRPAKAGIQPHLGVLGPGLAFRKICFTYRI